MGERTPLYDWHVAHGARMVDFAGWDMPIQYNTIIEEHQAVRTAAGLFDVSHMGRLVFDGPDALDFLQYLYTNDVSRMKPGQIRYGLVCNEAGGVLDDVLVYRLESFWLMVVNASNRLKILNWIERHLSEPGGVSAGRQVQVIDRTRDWGMLAIQGPKARQIVERCAPSAVGLNYYHGSITSTDPVRIWSRTGYTGEDGWEVIVPARELVGLVEQLCKIGGEVGVDLKPCGLGARDTLRLEAAMPLYGHELSEDIDPFQAGLGWAVKLDKGDFVGREALRKRRASSSCRIRVGLELAGKRIAREGAVVLVDGRPVGTVTSGTFAPTLGKAIAMAYVEPAGSAVGTKCTVDIRGKEESARVVPLPFYQRPRP